MNPQTTSNQAPAPRTIVPIAVLAIVALLVFSPTLGYNFLGGWDDHLYVTDNIANLRPTVANVTRWWKQSVAGSYHPLTMYSYMVDHAL